AENVGFKKINMGGYAVGAYSCITEPLMTMTEMADFCEKVVSAVNIPVTADGDAGYGDPIQVYRTVQTFEKTGLAGMFIEDQVYPKRAHYHRDYQEHTIPEAEMVEKIKMAIEARDDPDFVMGARTDTLKTHGLDEAIRRANAYLDAGADEIYLYPNTLEEAKIIPKKIPAPVSYLNSEGNRVGRPILTIKEAEDMGYKYLSNAISSIAVYAYSLKEVFENTLKTGNSGWEQEKMIEIRKMIEDIIDLPKLYEIEERTTEKKN
ncbi:MAG: isocitrate lyase/PEP mutase family protein, partial [Promethearchaeota archaeon]